MGFLHQMAFECILNLDQKEKQFRQAPRPIIYRTQFISFNTSLTNQVTNHSWRGIGQAIQAHHTPWNPMILGLKQNARASAPVHFQKFSLYTTKIHDFDDQPWWGFISCSYGFPIFEMNDSNTSTCYLGDPFDDQASKWKVDAQLEGHHRKKKRKKGECWCPTNGV